MVTRSKKNKNHRAAATVSSIRFQGNSFRIFYAKAVSPLCKHIFPISRPGGTPGAEVALSQTTTIHDTRVLPKQLPGKPGEAKDKKSEILVMGRPVNRY